MARLRSFFRQIWNIKARLVIVLTIVITIASITTYNLLRLKYKNEFLTESLKISDSTLTRSIYKMSLKFEERMDSVRQAVLELDAEVKKGDNDLGNELAKGIRRIDNDFDSSFQLISFNKQRLKDSITRVASEWSRLLGIEIGDRQEGDQKLGREIANNSERITSNYNRIVSNDKDITTLFNELDKVLPMGSIVPFKGDIRYIPTNWKLCNGENGTPDLSGRFVRGVDDYYKLGSNGGVDYTTHSHPMSEELEVDDLETRNVSSYSSSSVEVPPADEVKHSHTLESKTLDNRPKFVALYYIMKIK